MAFEKRGQNNITRPSLLLTPPARILDNLLWLELKLTLATFRPPRAIISSLSNFVLPLSFPNHTSRLISRLFLPPLDSLWNLHHCTLAPDMRHSTRNPFFRHHLLRQPHETASLQA